VELSGQLLGKKVTISTAKIIPLDPSVTEAIAVSTYRSYKSCTPDACSTPHYSKTLACKNGGDRFFELETRLKKQLLLSTLDYII
jgi:hypothetical protein